MYKTNIRRSDRCKFILCTKSLVIRTIKIWFKLYTLTFSTFQSSATQYCNMQILYLSIKVTFVALLHGMQLQRANLNWLLHYVRRYLPLSSSWTRITTFKPIIFTRLKQSSWLTLVSYPLPRSEPDYRGLTRIEPSMTHSGFRSVSRYTFSLNPGFLQHVKQKHPCSCRDSNPGRLWCEAMILTSTQRQVGIVFYALTKLTFSLNKSFSLRFEKV